MHYTKVAIEQLDSIQRLKIINAVSGVKPANLIGTVSSSGVTNLGVFNSVFHLGSNPPLQGFILRPTGEVPRHTYENLLQNGQYTINHIHNGIIEQAHYTSAKFKAEVSEFRECGLTEEYIDGFEAPFVKESHLKMGMYFKEAIPIELNDTWLIIGEIQHLVLPPEVFGEEDDVDLAAIDTVGISGLNTYYSLKKLRRFPYARVSEVPNFEKNQTE
ncbi:flavin oxidoreductase [Flavobacteriaceae bacterium TP-CH-4]|uniref:Flavin oxidoreductase n=1 Tax=Pelagihabitans pacificus TaxID=2696054 RepID=A0A967E893_9FLAO|nr:flavin reductase [Pelagihabitans pacificus]NHF61054.1 flavin oxidoreductase [Pelagihabitans pacificus]